MSIMQKKFFNKRFVLYLFLACMMCIAIYNINKDKVALATSPVPNGKVIYLTFDDGPSNNVTNKILDILKEKQVKATFFIVGYKIQGREDTLKRIAVEGSSIGLHTYTHNYKKIYSNENVFIDEMNRTRDEVKLVTGVSTNIIRFPAGSKPRLTKSFLDKLHGENYKIYDWNTSLSDGLDYNTSVTKLLKESTNVVKGASRIILLMHCDEFNENTCKALPQIIDLYKQKGYEFKAITEETPEYYFRLKQT